MAEEGGTLLVKTSVRVTEHMLSGFILRFLEDPTQAVFIAFGLTGPVLFEPEKHRNVKKVWMSGAADWASISAHHGLGDEGGIQDGRQRPGNFIHHSTNNTINVIGDNNRVVRSDGLGDRHMIVTQMMGLLSQYIIRGAEHDSSARDPPPRCHPETRVKLIARIIAWFEDQASLELLLWITGPAGVGKSAIVQTFTEYLVKSRLLGASVFISRPNKRDNPDGIFITVAYQLATRIEAYRNHIVERLRLDPELLRGDLQAQFTTFIVEPFTVKQIGASGRRWGILLDGLDELRGTDAQCEIIQLISSFVHEYPNAPLAWIIASRPESHISNTFEDDEVRLSCRSEHIPIDSTEACADVERFLRSSFKTTQKKFRHCVSSDWPSKTDFLKLTAAASGLFIYAEVAMQFIRDSGHADPVARFTVLLSVIDCSNAIPSEENPFLHLDALYHQILSSIPSTMWPTTKQLLGVSIYRPWVSNSTFLTLRGMSIFFGMTQSTVYASLDKSRSTLKISDWKVAHKKMLTFLHASFSDYLRDSKRSRDFYVGSEEDVKEEVWLRLLEIWKKCCGDDIATSSVELAWHQYCSELTDQSSSRAIEKFHTNLFRDAIYGLVRAMQGISQYPKESPAYTSLRKLHMRKFYYIFKEYGSLWDFVDITLSISPEPRHIGFLREVRLKDLEFGHLDWKEMSPAHDHFEKKSKNSSRTLITHGPCSSAELTAFVSDLKSLQEDSPELEVRIVGGVPKERVAVFKRPLKENPRRLSHFIYYVIPYPE
ncbi:hypothetical protein AGABI2DRAFT_122865 [Agaricus bisporus var. bisporus H97]|uniref:hypothetical protein n=1 Tax=Agaricus bisporus var. bisporus (strain H97 / ATCC MYA-4626 / FGSC 10389) TaxID=936046 RepID=UPI00029F6A26|nr:hypothetical protein AGABI2DRAFT_122865 [Agaricus bisporus var. bisporus H97]EKV42136.1 hypothetical protein AGABI2DRAFT_122865 [Agaricus bisporus var. bisporus H97]